MKALFSNLFTWLLLGSSAAQQFADDKEFYGNDPDHFTLECRTALNLTLDCTWLLGEFAGGDLPTVSHKRLNEICTSECSESLVEVQKQIHDACPFETNKLEVEGGEFISPTLTVDHLIDQHRRLCLKDRESSGFCYEIMGKWEEDGTIDDAEHECSDCWLGYKEIWLNATEGGPIDEDYEDFTSLTKSCKKTGFHPPTPVSTTEPAPTETYTKPCPSTYIIQEGDTCNSICKEHNVSTDALTWTNDIPAYCSHFPKAGTKICMPEKCQVYTVEEGDSCIEIVWAAPHDITIAQLLAWNPNLNPTCSNMYQQEGTQMCVSPPGDDPSKPPRSGAKGPATPARQPGNVANGTNTRCGKYHNVTSGETCRDVIGKSISFKDFYFLNSGVDSYCTNLLLGKSYCVAPVGDIVTYKNYGPTRLPQTTSTSTYKTFPLTPPATPRDDGKWILGKAPSPTPTTTKEADYTPLPLAPGTWNASRCLNYEYYWEAGDDEANDEFNGCQSLARAYRVTVEDLYKWNPLLKQQKPCMMKPGYQFCVQLHPTEEELDALYSYPVTPSTSAGNTKNSETTAVSTSTTAIDKSSGDGENTKKISKPTTNPTSEHIDGSATTAKSTTKRGSVKTVTKTATRTETWCNTLTNNAGVSVATPSPIPDGMKGGCKKFYRVKAGDYCDRICKENNISIEEFISWNPAVEPDCPLVMKDYYYCIGH